jgi:hypothetical protein
MLDSSKKRAHAFLSMVEIQKSYPINLFTIRGWQGFSHVRLSSKRNQLATSHLQQHLASYLSNSLSTTSPAY